MVATVIVLGVGGWGSDLFAHDESPELVSAASRELAGCHFRRRVLLQRVAKVKICEVEMMMKEYFKKPNCLHYINVQKLKQTMCAKC
jgi:hypothetical protein